MRINPCSGIDRANKNQIRLHIYTFVILRYEIIVSLLPCVLLVIPRPLYLIWSWWMCYVVLVNEN